MVTLSGMDPGLRRELSILGEVGDWFSSKGGLAAHCKESPKEMKLGVRQLTARKGTGTAPLDNRAGCLGDENDIGGAHADASAEHTNGHSLAARVSQHIVGKFLVRHEGVLLHERGARACLDAFQLAVACAARRLDNDG